MYKRQKKTKYEAKTQKKPPAKKNLSIYQNQQHNPKSKPANTLKKPYSTCYLKYLLSSKRGIYNKTISIRRITQTRNQPI